MRVHRVPGGERSARRGARTLARVAAPVGLFVILHAFSSGATALTGVEAISDGVPAFRRPRAKNAAQTLAIMGVISVTMFLGISFLATHIQGITVSEEGSVVGQIAHAVFRGGLPFYIVQFFTARSSSWRRTRRIRTSRASSSILARDRFMPRQFGNRGDRLVFSNGVIVLGSLACLLIIAFEADLNRLIQLYVVGVFTAFTLSQTGMVRHWLKEKHKGDEAQKGWRRSIVINTIGAVVDVRRALHRLVHEVHRRCVDRVRGRPHHHGDVPVDPPALHRHDGAAEAPDGPSGRSGRQPRGAARPRSGSADRGGARVPAVVPVRGGARGLPGAWWCRTSGGPGSLADVRRWRAGSRAAGVSRRRSARCDACVSQGHRAGAAGFRDRARSRRRSRKACSRTCSGTASSSS